MNNLLQPALSGSGRKTLFIIEIIVIIGIAQFFFGPIMAQRRAYYFKYKYLKDKKRAPRLKGCGRQRHEEEVNQLQPERQEMQQERAELQPEHAEREFLRDLAVDQDVDNGDLGDVSSTGNILIFGTTNNLSLIHI